ncbi:hypothetical protein UA08_05711 [Talaromyces atroroseus]|uniref:Uncharacterized protein n=1 Tax=Talaromyces atroroseus TaxID=1441469 RepID=A0A225AD55_TALAT|nr:hypothetical protein UA08_05711 [Talaromyces atroroseus]OKL59082.1 hypothetical protein UA08_05711 [Talaromyces atroroseus]
MSTVRYFNDVPHIVRYGMRDDEEERCWILFWRNGTQFEIHVDKQDVHGTAFYSAWRPMLREGLKEGETMKDHLENQWNPFCDLIISHSMATLQRLAPVGPYWITLSDYFHTPSYDLKLVTDRESGNVYGKVTNGPKEQAAYGFQTISAAAFRNMPKDIPHYASSDLVVVDRAENWKVPPRKVRTVDGHVYFFKACERSSTSLETGEVTNAALNSIEVCLKLFKYSQVSHSAWAAERPTVLGIVTDTSAAPSGSASEYQVAPEHAVQASQHEAGMTETLVAGILLPPIPRGQTLAEVTEQVERMTLDTAIDQSRLWKSQIEKEVALMHSLGIYWGGREDWFYINQHTILVDAKGQASLDLGVASSVNGSVSEGLATRGFAMDTKAVDAVFEEWLPTELSNRK